MSFGPLGLAFEHLIDDGTLPQDVTPPNSWSAHHLKVRCIEDDGIGVQLLFEVTNVCPAMWQDIFHQSAQRSVADVLLELFLPDAKL